MNGELGIYIHIPFCAKKCEYCDFLSSVAKKSEIEEYVEALCCEISVRGSFLEADGEGKKFHRVKSIFFGGGTPSLLNPYLFEKIMRAVRDIFYIEETAEITVECNPESVTEEKLCCYQNCGVNRLSFGLQSANEEELKMLGRIHTWEKFLESYQAARIWGFSNINIDLMSALPDQTEESWERTLQKVIALCPEHISAYSLILEEGTAFYEKRESLHLPDEDAERNMYARTGERLKEFGYSRYEISNYAKPGYMCQHNMRYWSGGEYAGFGIGASSYLFGTRFRNTRNKEFYQRECSNPERLVREKEILTQQARMEEFMFLGLRKIAGITKSEFYHCFGIEIEQIYGETLIHLQKEGVLEKEGERIFLTEYGVDVSNIVLAEFLLS